MTLNEATRKIAKLKHTQALTQVQRAARISLDEYKRTADRILDVIYTVRLGHMHLSSSISEYLEVIYTIVGNWAHGACERY